MPPEQNLESCPFSGSKNLSVRTEDDSSFRWPESSVVCNDCGAQRPPEHFYNYAEYTKREQHVKATVLRPIRLLSLAEATSKMVEVQGGATQTLTLV
jgi:hypothetical protein